MTFPLPRPNAALVEGDDKPMSRGWLRWIQDLVTALTCTPGYLLKAGDDGLADDSMAYEGASGIGIGTDAPQELLHLKSTQPCLKFTKTGILNWWIGVKSSNNFTIYADASGGTPARFSIDSDGNLGIGTASPTSILHVVGLPVYANNAAAIAAGLTAGSFYRTGGDPDPVCVVH